MKAKASEKFLKVKVRLIEPPSFESVQPGVEASASATAADESF
jgi:hypothetical protein